MVLYQIFDIGYCDSSLFFILKEFFDVIPLNNADNFFTAR